MEAVLVGERDELTVVVSVTGDLDRMSCDEIDSMIQTAVLLWPRVVVDLGMVTFCDSSGLRMLMRCEQAASEHGGRLVIANASAPVRRVFEITGLDQLLAQ